MPSFLVRACSGGVTMRLPTQVFADTSRIFKDLQGTKVDLLCCFASFRAFEVGHWRQHASLGTFAPMYNMSKDSEGYKQKRLTQELRRLIV